MPFGLLGRLGPRMRQVVRIGCCLMGKGNFGVYVRRHIVTGGDFVAQLCKSAWGPHPPRGKGDFGTFSGSLILMEFHSALAKEKHIPLL